jgi:hypothetical protein
MQTILNSSDADPIYFGPDPYPDSTTEDKPDRDPHPTLESIPTNKIIVR